jgi:hypothetical protein
MVPGISPETILQKMQVSDMGKAPVKESNVGWV